MTLKLGGLTITSLACVASRKHRVGSRVFVQGFLFLELVLHRIGLRSVSDMPATKSRAKAVTWEAREELTDGG